MSAVNALRFSTVRHSKDNRPQTHEATFADFAEYVRGRGKQIPLSREEFTLLPDGERKRLKDGPAVILAVFDPDLAPLSKKGGWRGEAHVAEVTGATFDLDDGNPSIAEVAACLDGIACVIHESASSSPERRKLRVFVPYSEPVGIAQHRSAWRALAKHLRPEWLDAELGNDPGRLCYAPPSFAGGECGEMRVLEGERYDPSAAIPSGAPAKANGKARHDVWKNFDFGADRSELARLIASGADYHDSLLRLAASLRATGSTEEMALGTLRGLMEAAKPTDAAALERWQREWDDLPRTVQFERVEQAADAEQQNAMIEAYDLIAHWNPPEADAMLEVEPMSWLVERLIPHGKVGMVNGAGGTNKTTLMIELMIAVAMGEPWFGFPVEQTGTSVLLSGEDSKGDLHAARAELLKARIERINAAKGTERDKRRLVERLVETVRQKVRLISLRGKTPAFTLRPQYGSGYMVNTDTQEMLLEALGGIEDLRLVVPDTLRRFAQAPSIDEEAMSKAISVAEYLSEHLPTQPTIPLLHHVAKEVARKGIEDQHTALGSGAIGDNTRWGFNLRELPEEEAQKLYNLTAEEIATAKLGTDRLAWINVAPARGFIRSPKEEPFLISRKGWHFERRLVTRKSEAERVAEGEVAILKRIEALEGEPRVTQAMIFSAVPCKHGEEGKRLKALGAKGLILNRGSSQKGDWRLTEAGHKTAQPRKFQRGGE